MNTQHSLTAPLKAFAMAGAFSFIATVAAHAAFQPLPQNGIEGSVTLTNMSGTFGTGLVVGSLDSPYSETINNEFSGILRTRVVSRTGVLGGPLDFYYELVNLSPGKPPIGSGGDSDIFRFSTDGGYGGLSNIFVSGETGLVAGVPAGGKFALTADRGFGSDGVGFEFQPTPPPTPFIGDPRNLDVGQTSQWLVVRTNETQFTSVLGVIDGFGTGIAGTFAPIPEPTTIGFGLGILGVCASGWLKARRKVAA